MSSQKEFSKKNLVVLALVLLAIISRLIPHPLNFTSVGALGLFAGAYILDKRIWLLPLCALLISDLFVGFYEPVAMLFVYIGFALSAVIGRYVLSEKRSFFRLGGAAITSATLFFIVSNFGTWLTGTLYPMSITGLIECYIMAIPFYGNTLTGDIFYMAILFGGYESYQVWLQKRQLAQATA